MDFSDSGRVAAESRKDGGLSRVARYERDRCRRRVDVQHPGPRAARGAAPRRGLVAAQEEQAGGVHVRHQILHHTVGFMFFPNVLLDFFIEFRVVGLV